MFHVRNAPRRSFSFSFSLFHFLTSCLTFIFIRSIYSYMYKVQCFMFSCLPVFIFDIHSCIFDINCYIFCVMYFMYVELVKFDRTRLPNTNTTRINGYRSSNLTRLLNGSDPNWPDFFPYRVRVKVLSSFTRLMTWLYFLF